ncbi:MAG: DNA-directed RNA polymerase subunit D [Candidatus Nanohaloarchaeota archaeon]|nr:DNA-directed RNA polymerase subunit D [Candidatus Nanohaloarchaeota archaeon]
MSINAEVIDQGKDFVKIRIKGAPASLVNAIRRKILNGVETAAVEYIEVNKNTSGLYNEIIAHRLAMIPFTFTKVIQNRNKCECEDLSCSKCSVRFVLKKKGPGIVYSKDIKTVHEDFKPLYDDIPIVRLLEGQEIDIEGIITLGSGKDHAKYIPAIVGYEEIEPDNVYEMHIETISALDPLTIFKEAVELLESEIAKIEKIL